MIVALLIVFYVVFGNKLREKGYDPIEKITQTAEFAADVNNPNWEKGRSIPRGYAIASWEKNVWTGVGYDVLYHHGSPSEVGTAHNFVITSLFHRGVVGTAIYLIILIGLFANSMRLWFKSRRESGYENDLVKLLIIASFFWIVPFWNQEVIWEKYSLSIQFLYFGLITNIRSQKLETQQRPARSISRPRYTAISR
jgi:O-antigen ligase